MQVSTPKRDNRRPAQEQTGGTPTSKRGGMKCGAGSTTKLPPKQEQQQAGNSDEQSIEWEQPSTNSNNSNAASMNTAPEGKIVVTENVFTFVNSRSPRRSHQNRHSPQGGRGGSGRGRGFGGGNLTGSERRYRKAIHPLVTGVLRKTAPQENTTNHRIQATLETQQRKSTNGVYLGGYYQALAEFDDEDTTLQEEEITLSSEYEYNSQPGDLERNEPNIGRPRQIPTSLQEALQLLSSYKLLPKAVDADPAGGHPHCD